MHQVFEIKSAENIEKDVPRPRSGHRIIVDEGNIYSFGGYNPNATESEDEDQLSSLFKELWKFNVCSKRWTKLKTTGSMPEELASHSVTLYKGNLLVYGGTGEPFGLSNSNKFHIINLKELEWSEIKTKGKPPLKQYGQAIALQGDDVYVVGGTTGFEYSIDVHRFNLITNEWTELPCQIKPKKRYRHEIAIYEDKIFLFGGGTANASFGFENVPVFDIKKQKWEEGRKTYPDLVVAENQGFPAKRRCHSCVQNNEDIFLCGGHHGQTIYSDLWKLRLSTMQWTKLNATLPLPVFFHSSTLAVTGQMYLFGGVIKARGTTSIRTNKLFGVWLRLPSLLQLAWNSLLRQAPELYRSTPEFLLSIGIPAALLNTVDFESNKRKESYKVMPEPVMP